MLPSMPEAPAKAYDVFLSHSHDDAEIVEQLAKLLRSRELEVWLDKWVLIPGRPWRQDMAKGLEQAASCAVCIGTKTPKGWFEAEISRALNRQSQYQDFGVIPVILPGGDRTLVNEFLELNTWVIFKDGIADADALHRLISGIKGLAPGSGPDKPTPSARIFTVPIPQNPFFTERANELSDFGAALEKTGSYALTGLGGVGKTQTAAEYAHRYRDNYQSVIWLRAEKEDTLFADLTALAHSLQLPQADAKEQQLAVESAHRWLDDNDNWLLVLDNVNDLKTVQTLTRKARPKRHHVIVTQKAQATGAIASSRLREMETDQGALLLLRRAKLITPEQQLPDAKPADVDVARKICREVDGLPLALAQAGAYIERTSRGLPRYLEMLTKGFAKVMSEPGGEDIRHEPVVATFSLSLQELENGHPASAELLKAVAFLSPDKIPEEIFTKGSDSFTPALKTASADEFEWDKAITAALDFALLERNSSDETLTVHRAVQQVTKLRMSDEERAHWAARVVNAVASALPQAEFENWGAYERLLPQAQVCAGLTGEYKLSTVGSALLLNQTGYYLYQRARYALAELLYRSSLTIAEEAFGSDSGEVAIRLNNLALLLQDTNRLAEAEPLMRRALSIDEKSYGPDHPTVALRLNNLAQLLQDTNRLAEAEPLMRRALSIDEKSYGPDDPNVARDLNNLALLLQDTNRLAEAESLLRRGLSIDEKSYGPNHPNLAIRLNNLAQLLQATNRLAEAEPLMRRALAIDEQSYGLDHPTVAIRLNNLAYLLKATNRLDEVEPLYRRSLKIDENSYGPNHPNVARDLNNLARLQQATNRLPEAEPLMCRMVEIFLRFKHDTQYEHRNFRAGIENYQGLLLQMGYSDDQIRAKLHELAAKYGVSLNE
jgi:tetratricopeptide (TPR) repeat protein